MAKRPDAHHAFELQVSLPTLMIEFPLARRNLRVEEENIVFRSHRLSAALAIVTLGVTAAAGGSRPESITRDVVEITELQPFIHVAYILAGSDLSSIKIEGIKAAKVATTGPSIMNQQYCDLPWSEPGGSMYCQRTTDGSSVPAYRVTFSYRGQPMASDEYGNPYFTFSVYFRPVEISPRLRQMVSSGKIARGKVAEFFAVATSTDSIQQVVIDEPNSMLCEKELCGWELDSHESEM